MTYRITSPSNAGIANTLNSWDETNQLAARNGNGSFDPADSTERVGQSRPWGTLNGAPRSFYYYRECFLEYAIVGYAAGQLPVTGFIQFLAASQTAEYQWDIQGFEHDWGGGAVNLSKWMKPADILPLSEIWRLPIASYYSSNQFVDHAGSTGIRDRMGTAQTLRMLFVSDYHVRGIVSPQGRKDYGTLVNTGNIVHGSATSTTLTYVAGASVQLTDGTVAYLSIDTGTVQLRHTADNGANSTLIATIPQGASAAAFTLINGQQSMALVRDKNNNLFVLGASGAVTQINIGVARNRNLAVQAFTKGSGYTWTAGTVRRAPTSYGEELGYEYVGDINNVAATYHDYGTGYLAAVVSHTNSSKWRSQQYVVSLSVDALLSNANPFTDWAATQASSPYQTITGSSGDLRYPMNDTGTGLDICALPNGGGSVATFISSNQNAGGRSSTAYARTAAVFKYALNSSGAFTTEPTPVVDGSNNWASPMRDCDGKIRIVPVGTTGYVVVTASGMGVFSTGHVLQRSINGSASGRKYPRMMYPPDAGAGIDDRTVHFSPNWDVVYDPATRSVILYSIDTTAGAVNWRTVVASHWSIDTTTPPATERQVAATLGPSGSRNVAFRAPRQVTDVRKILLHLGNVAAAGTASTVFAVDSGVNSAPNAPTLGTVTPFSAGTAKTFSWTFSDSNVPDAQSAYEMEIRRASDSVVVHQPGKVTSTTPSRTVTANTLAASTSYQWRVRTYDTNDAQGAWSAWTAFSTVTGPIVNITIPVTDNEPWTSSSITITWDFASTTGSTQASFRVRVLRESNQAVLYDSGLIAGAATRTFTVPTGTLLSDVQQRLQVIATDSASVVSQPGARLITPSFSTPPTPVLTLAPSDVEAAVVLAITNPAPTGENPPPVRNDVYRRRAATLGYPAGDWVLIGSAAPDETYTDLTLANRVVYDYLARGVTAAGGSADSNILAEVSVQFVGVWLHSAVAPLRQFQYFRERATQTVAPQSERMVFAGRARPVVAFGETPEEGFALTIHLPYSETYDDECRYLLDAVKPVNQPIYYRDVRGRAEWCVLTLQIVDADDGSQVPATFTPVDYVDVGVA